jgi:murein L,D-transpeptidase YcbB/YkuD
MFKMVDFPARIIHPDYESRVLEYFALAVKQELSPDLCDQDADRLGAILEEAESDSMLHFWINEADYMIGLRMGLLEDEHLKLYQDQQAWLNEYLEVQNPENLDHYRRVQKLLQTKGFYQGPVDGVFDNDSREAVKDFQKSSHTKVDGRVGMRTLLKKQKSCLRRYITLKEFVIKM